MKVAIIDYGMGNLGSVRRALDELDAKAVIVSRPEQAASADRLVLPGVGSFADGMASLRDSGWIAAIREQVVDKGKPLLGICLGMQLLADHGDEGLVGGFSQGLGLVRGKVVRLDRLGCAMRIPHVGWNAIEPATDTALFAGIPDGTDFYFVHSYAFQAEEPADVFATCDYGVRFAAAIGRGNVMGTQFHPEKSSRAGFSVLRNFLEISPC
ncbi:MAG: imidazole glycerol phosphate synthase subunit HisH [Proteobacteria bacterium]|nr:imidazole glycerol phosphate synthase subunit HisH [Pseudomonadota bacterium]